MDNQQLSLYEKGHLAGMIDGDGCIKIHKRSATAIHVRVSFTKPCLEFVEKFKDYANRYGCNISNHKSVISKKRQEFLYRAEITNRVGIYKMLSDIIPFLAEKKQRAIAVCNFIKERDLSGSTSKKYTFKQAELALKVLECRASNNDDSVDFLEVTKYNLQDITDTERGWVTGIFDCDGSILLKGRSAKGVNHIDRYIVFTNVSKTNLKKFYAICSKVGIFFHIRKRKTYNMRRVSFNLTINKISHMKLFLDNIGELIVKRHKAKIMHQFCVNRMNAFQRNEKYSPKDLEIVNSFYI